MLLYDQGSLSWQTFYKAELRSIVFDKENTKKKYCGSNGNSSSEH